MAERPRGVLKEDEEEERARKANGLVSDCGKVGDVQLGGAEVQ